MRKLAVALILSAIAVGASAQQLTPGNAPNIVVPSATEVDFLSLGGSVIYEAGTSVSGAGASSYPFLAAGGSSVARVYGAGNATSLQLSGKGAAGGSVTLGVSGDTTTAAGPLIVQGTIAGNGGAFLSNVSTTEWDVLNSSSGILAKVNGSGSATYPVLSAGGGTIADMAAGGSGTTLRIASGGTAQMAGNFQTGAGALTLTNGAVGVTKITASASAPGAAGGKLELVCGTNAGTAKLIAYAGTSATAVTIVDNIGTGVTGC